MEPELKVDVAKRSLKMGQKQLKSTIASFFESEIGSVGVKEVTSPRKKSGGYRMGRVEGRSPMPSSSEEEGGESEVGDQELAPGEAGSSTGPGTRGGRQGGRRRGL